MPLFYQHAINQTTKLAIWKIEEEEDFFLQQVPLQASVTHPHKRLQHLAGRYLLKYLFPDFPYEEILIADTRKPYLPAEQYHFSISHCDNYAAAIVSSRQRVGIDIEIASAKVQRISHKFIHGNENEWLAVVPEKHQVSNLELQTILWSAKEAIFKWYSLGEIDFREHMQLYGKIKNDQEEWLVLPFKFLKHGAKDLEVYSKKFEPLMMAWLASEEQELITHH